MRNGVARLVCYIGLCLLTVAAPQHAASQVKVGFLHRDADKYDVEWREYWGFGRHMADDGFVSGLAEIGGIYRGGVTEDQLYEALRRFNVVVWPMAYEGSYHLTDALLQNATVARSAFERYVAEGGGLFIIAQAVRYPGDDDEEFNNLIIEGFGARMMHEGIHDSAREFTSPGGLVIRPETFFFTESVAAHPVTAGVKRIYLPTKRGRAPGVAALAYSDDWTVALTGGETAKSYFVGHDNILDLEQEATYQSAPPIAAVREFGKGRIFVYAVPYRQLFLNYGNPVWPHISEELGDEAGGRPSDSLKMAFNALRWLAEPSLGIEGFGSFQPAPYRPIEYAESVEWDSQEFPAPTEGARGLVGAHTSFTDGAGTVARYADAAKSAGLSFLVFTEPLEMLSEDEFAGLKRDCEAASDDDFYACPGVEFTDALGIRWAAWGEKVIYPPPVMPQRGQDYMYFDGEVVHLTGKYAIDNAFGPNAIVGMDRLHQSGAHPANLWWFFRFFPLIYEGDRLIEDDYDDFLYSLRDLRWMSLSSFTRVRDPAQVAVAAQACCTILPRPEHVKQWCNSRCGTYHPAYGKSYVTQGPHINLWWAINSQMENPWKTTRGAQRVRLKFTVSSEVGIRDVTIHDANFGLIRRFDGQGAHELTREFEMVHDRQHYLALVATDVEGRRALGNYWLLYCYKSGLYRCGDNLNTLGSAAVLLHPDRHQRLMLHKVFEDVWKITLRGFDTGAGIASQPSIFPLKLIETPDGAYPRERGLMTAGVLDVPMASYDVSITSMDFSSLAPRYEYEGRCTPSMGGILPLVGPHEYAEWSETAYILRSRMDYFTAWNHRRVFEGSQDYRGGLIWHDGVIRIRKDVVVKPGIPIPLFCVQGPGGAAHRTSDHLFVLDAERGPMHWQVSTDDEPPADCAGTIEAGGYAALMPTDVGYLAFLAGPGSPFRYSGHHWAKTRGANGRVYVGFGKPQGGVMKAGTEIPYRFLMATINDKAVSADLMADQAEAYNLDGGTDGYPFEVKVGEFADAEFFFTVAAAEGETVIEIGPRKTICDLAFRVRGIEDNGCAAVYVKGQDFFRFVAVSEGSAYFQEPIDPAIHLWAGNVLLCDCKDAKMTLVMLGQAEGAQRFLEVHNPRAEPLQARVWSPEHTPIFGGTKLTLDLPAGDSVRVPLDA